MSKEITFKELKNSDYKDQTINEEIQGKFNCAHQSEATRI